MGTNYEQQCIVGFMLGDDEAKHILSPAVYEEQARYNTRTGKQTHTEKVLVKEEDYVYRFGDCEGYDLYDLGNTIANKHNVDFFHDDDGYLFIGKFVGETNDYGRVDLLEDTVSFSLLQSLREDVQDIFKDQCIELHFVTSVG